MTGNRIQVIVGELGLIILAGYHYGILGALAAAFGFAVMNGVVGACLYEEEDDNYDDDNDSSY